MGIADNKLDYKNISNVVLFNIKDKEGVTQDDVIRFLNISNEIILNEYLEYKKAAENRAAERFYRIVRKKIKNG